MRRFPSIWLKLVSRDSRDSLLGNGLMHAGFHLFRSCCVNPLGVPDNLTAGVPPFRKKKKTQESSSGGANHNCVVTVAGITGNLPTRRQAGSSGGNSSKYIYVLFSPQRHLWSNSVLFRYLHAVYFTPKHQVPMEQPRANLKCRKAWEINEGKENIYLFSLSPYP